jgi:hypothetical protein
MGDQDNRARDLGSSSSPGDMGGAAKRGETRNRGIGQGTKWKHSRSAWAVVDVEVFEVYLRGISALDFQQVRGSLPPRTRSSFASSILIASFAASS